MPAARTQDGVGGVGKAKAAAFDTRTFAGPLAAKAYACFVRRYDANHLARHPKQKLGAMKLLVEETRPRTRPSTTRSDLASSTAIAPQQA